MVTKSNNIAFFIVFIYLGNLIFHLWFYNSAIIFTQCCHSFRIDWIFSCFLFINVYSQTRFISNNKIAIFDYRASRKNFLHLWWKSLLFLNTKIIYSYVNMIVCLMSNR